MAALDDAIGLLDTIIARLRPSVPSKPPAEKAVAVKTQTASSSNLPPPCEAATFEAPCEADTSETGTQNSEIVSASDVSMPCEVPQASSTSEGAKAQIDGLDHVEDFEKAFLQVGQVVSVEDHPVAEKLYVCKVEVAEDQLKQVVAGLRKFLPPSELLHRRVCLVLNLKPAKLAGQLSEAMILAGEANIDGILNVKILQPPSDASVGDRIYLEGSAPSVKPAKQLSSKIWEKLLAFLHVEGGVAKFNQKSLVTCSGAIIAPDLPNGSSIH